SLFSLRGLMHQRRSRCPLRSPMNLYVEKKHLSPWYQQIIPLFHPNNFFELTVSIFPQKAGIALHIRAFPALTRSPKPTERPTVIEDQVQRKFHLSRLELRLHSSLSCHTNP